MHLKSEYNRIKSTINQMAGDRLAVSKSCFGQITDGIDVPSYQIYAGFIRKMAHDLAEEHDRLNQSQINISAQEAVVKNETVNRKALETLKDHRYHKYVSQVRQTEQKTLDELVTMRRPLSI